MCTAKSYTSQVVAICLYLSLFAHHAKHDLHTTRALRPKYKQFFQMWLHQVSEPVLKPEHQNSSISIATYCLCLPSERNSCPQNIRLKSSCKHISAEGVVYGLNECEDCKCLTYWGGNRKKKKKLWAPQRLSKKNHSPLKNASLPLRFLLWNGCDKPTQQVISFGLRGETI